MTGSQPQRGKTDKILCNLLDFATKLGRHESLDLRAKVLSRHTLIAQT